MNTGLMLDEVIEKLQKYKDMYGNIPVLLIVSSMVETIDDTNCYVMDIIGDKNNITIYNY